MSECNGKCEGHQIVARIWKQLGDPSYSELDGRDIHDLIDERAALIAKQSALLAQMAAALEDARQIMAEEADPAYCTRDPIPPSIQSALTAYSASSPDPLYAEAKWMYETLEFYANPAIYKPHPHGSAFDKRQYLHQSAEYALKRARGEG